MQYGSVPQMFVQAIQHTCSTLQVWLVWECLRQDRGATSSGQQSSLRPLIVVPSSLFRHSQSHKQQWPDDVSPLLTSACIDVVVTGPALVTSSGSNFERPYRS